MKIFISFLLFCSVTISLAGKSPNGEKYLASLSPEERAALPKELSEDALLDVPGLVDKYGYNAEIHTVTTEDGYILTMHRIAGKKGTENDGNRPVAFLMHGLMGSSAAWVVGQSPSDGFGYYLSNAGYDVWLGNARGNFYSRNHTEYNPDGRLFWNFSWHQIGYYDLPAMIDYILENTGQERLHYVGHSQGTTVFFVMASTRPDYNDKTITMQAFAPVVYMTNAKNPFITYLSQHATSIHYLLTLIGQNEFFPNSKFIAELAHEHCKEGAIYIDFCIMIIFGDSDMEHINQEMMPLYLSHFPNGASSRQPVHYAQEYLSGKFRNYDHGFIANYYYYKSLTPPDYKIKRITAPVALHFSDNDSAVHPADVMKLFAELKNAIGAFRIARPTFTHADFVKALDAKEQLYDRVLEIMREYETQDH